MTAETCIWRGKDKMGLAVRWRMLFGGEKRR